MHGNDERKLITSCHNCGHVESEAILSYENVQMPPLPFRTDNEIHGLCMSCNAQDVWKGPKCKQCGGNVQVLPVED